jgi:glycine/D-amino acid oxidase-like deaminating enzyme
LINEAEVAVVGGGIMGLSAAYHLAKLGVSVVLVEMDKIAAGASGSNAGAIRGSDVENPTASPIYEASYKMYHDWNENGELGYDLEVSVVPVLRCFTEEHLEAMKRGLWKKRLEAWTGLEGLRVARRREWRIPEPNIAEDVTWGIESTNTMINLFRVTQGLARAAERNGARIITQTRVIGIEVKNGQVCGISTSRGKIRARFIVNAAGSWAPVIGRMVGLKIPIVPAIGTALVTEPTQLLTYHGRIVYDPLWFDPHHPYIPNSEDPCERLGVTTEIDRHSKEDNYILARSEHDVALPEEGAKTLVEPETLKCIAQSAIRIVPKLRNINIMRVYAGMRPVCQPDGNPILGKVEGVEGFIMAAGSWHTGMSYGPAMGKLVSEIVVGKKPSIPIDGLGFSRLT